MVTTGSDRLKQSVHDQCLDKRNQTKLLAIFSFRKTDKIEKPKPVGHTDEFILLIEDATH